MSLIYSDLLQLPRHYGACVPIAYIADLVLAGGMRSKQTAFKRFVVINRRW